jgi:hypothetical protein
MRQSLIFGAVLLLSAFAAGQATIVSGYAGNWGPSYGYYVAPFVPLVTTPIVEFGTPSLQVGARNATAGNITGASSIILGSTSGTVVAQPLTYSSTTTSEAQAAPNSRPGNSAEQQTFDLGIASFQDNLGLAQLARRSNQHRQVAGTYTNEDIKRLNQQNGIARYDGKTERLE